METYITILTFGSLNITPILARDVHMYTE